MAFALVGVFTIAVQSTASAIIIRKGQNITCTDGCEITHYSDGTYSETSSNGDWIFVYTDGSGEGWLGGPGGDYDMWDPYGDSVFGDPTGGGTGTGTGQAG
jgi:hypothetical protein